MSTSSEPDSKLPQAAPRAPVYQSGARRGSYLARFNDGGHHEVEPGRVRAYPGLRGEAPSMTAFYDAFASLLASGRVLDAGSGSGVGTRRLLERGLSVVAVDIDDSAVAFAKAHAPGAEYVVSDLAELRAAREFDGAIIADVLGHALEPDAALLGVARALRPGAQLLIAEAAAHVSQRLSAPHRRGFSVARLRSLLVRTGFDVEAPLCDHVPFIAFIAHAAAPEVRDAFAAAHAAAARGQLLEAKQALNAARVRRTSAVELEVVLAESELCLAQGDGDGAAAACFRAQELAPSDARSFIGLARIALAGGAASDALQLALEALRHDATEPAAYAVAGVAADALGHPDVFTAWRAAVNLAPDDAAIVGELARIASGRGDHALALTSFERLERYGVPLSAEHHLARGFILLALGRRSEAEIEAHLAHGKGASETELEPLKQALAIR